MKLVLATDTMLTKLIGRLPAGLHRPFHLLGIVFQPAGWGLLLLVYILLSLPTSAADAWLILLLLPAATLIKLLFRRTRPPTIYAENMRVKSYSFPSSHAYAAALAGTYFASQALDHDIGWLAGLSYTLIVVIGTSRVHLGAHYPSDVMFGWIMGAAICGVILW
ncbi:MAG TPA: phosphatase PAP2 family protein [Candidatus Saccharimonadales bacterium]